MKTAFLVRIGITHIGFEKMEDAAELIKLIAKGKFVEKTYNYDKGYEELEGLMKNDFELTISRFKEEEEEESIQIKPAKPMNLEDLPF